MIKRWLVLLVCAHLVSVTAAEPLRDGVDKLIAAATNSDFAFNRLAVLCDTFGPRFSGSTNLEASIDWVLAEMKKDGLQNVRGEPVMVPHWVRGEESAELLLPRPHRIEMLGSAEASARPRRGSPRRFSS